MKGKSGPRTGIKYTLERFWAKVKKTNSCWLWMGAHDSDGYGNFRFNGKNIKPHRFSYELVNGVIKGGLVVDHRCRVRECVNPQHMRVVSQGENILCGKSPSAINKRKTKCIRGHKLSRGNFYYDSKGSRVCRKCIIIRNKKYESTKKKRN